MQTNNKINSLLRILGAIVTIAIAAQLTVNIGRIPITGQTLAVLALAFFLNPKESFIAILGYLILGFCGVPIFANGTFGLDKLYGVTGGYLVGFLTSSTLVSFLKSKIKSLSFATILGLTFLGTIIILVLGIARLTTTFGIEKAIKLGFNPFWQGALIKVFIGSLIVWSIKRYSHR